MLYHRYSGFGGQGFGHLVAFVHKLHLVVGLSSGVVATSGSTVISDYFSYYKLLLVVIVFPRLLMSLLYIFLLRIHVLQAHPVPERQGEEEAGEEEA